MCNICGNQNLLLFWKAWPGGIELCSKMQLAGNDYRCILICMFACWKSFAMQLWQQKFLQILHHFWTPKWRLKNGPKNGARIWSPKWGPKMAPKRGTQYSFGSKKIYKKSKLYLKYWVSLLGAIFGPHFGDQILAPFLGPFFNLHFEVQKWCKICKSFCCQSCIAKLFPANKHAYQNASVVISQLIASFNTIQSSTWSSLPK